MKNLFMVRVNGKPLRDKDGTLLQFEDKKRAKALRDEQKPKKGVATVSYGTDHHLFSTISRKGRV